MYKKLSMFCILILMLFSLTSCARRLSYVDRLECTRYCAHKNCVKGTKFKSFDYLGNPTTEEITWIDRGCVYWCLKDCEYCNNKMVKEWKDQK